MEEESFPASSVLIVEDQEVVAHIVTAALEEMGHEATHVETGFEALDLMEQRRFDLIVLDVNLSRPNSTEVLRSLNKKLELRTIPVLGLILPGETGIAARARRLGVDEFLQQPFEPEELKERVRSLVGPGTGDE